MRLPFVLTSAGLLLGAVGLLVIVTHFEKKESDQQSQPSTSEAEQQGHPPPVGQGQGPVQPQWAAPSSARNAFSDPVAEAERPTSPASSSTQPTPANGSSDRDMAELLTAVGQEVLEPNWARSSEAAVRLAIADVSDVTEVRVQCGSIRCSAEATVDSSRNMNRLMRKLQTVQGLARARIRVAPNPAGGFLVKGVLARNGYTVFGGSDGSPAEETAP